jgi:hypothetical protein
MTMANYRDDQMVDYAKKAARQMNSPLPQPGGALGNTSSGQPDFEKGALPSNKARPNFAEGGSTRGYGAVITPQDIENRKGTLRGLYGGPRYDPLTEEGASDENLRANQKQRKGQLGYSRGGMVKAGSPKVSAPCRDTKTIKC